MDIKKMTPEEQLEYERAETVKIMESLAADDPFREYFREIIAVEPLSEEEKATLIPRLSASDEAEKTRVTETQLCLAVCIAARHRKSRLPIIELIHEANIGLVKAVESFSEGDYGAFKDYAERYVEKHLVRFIKSCIIEIPRVTPEMLERARIAMLERENTETEGSELFEQMCDNERLAPQEVEKLLKMAAEEDDGLILVREAVMLGIDKELSTRETELIELRFGILDGKPQGAEAVGERLGITPERVQQLEAKAIRKLCRSESFKLLRVYAE